MSGTPSKLGSLKSQLTKLRSARDGIRAGTAISTLGFWLFGLLALWFILDYTFLLSSTQRLLMLVISLPVFVYGISQSFAALHGWGASLIDTAISVEHRLGIDGDLVAALQFEQGHAIGSPELQGAVVDYVAEMKDDLDVFDGFDGSLLRNRFLTLGILLVGVIGVYLLAPNHLSAFLRRMTLANVNYPTHTRIDSITINGETIATDGSRPATVGYGRSVDFSVQVSGVIPKSGVVLIRDESGQQSEGVLEPAEDAPGQLNFNIPKLIQPVTFRLFAGDARTSTLSIDLVPLPALGVDLAIRPPSHASQAQFATQSSSTHVSVLASSDVDLKVIADRDLVDPRIIIRQGGESSQFPLNAVPENQHNYQISSADVLRNLQQTVSYEVLAIDAHGLEPASPLRGTIRVVPDRVPLASLQSIHKIVLPTATPILQYRASDDFALKELALQLTIEKANTNSRVVEVPLASFESEEAPVKLNEGAAPLELSTWQLERGDRVLVVLRAYDYRSGEDVEPGTSEPLTLEIGDESDVLAAISEADEQSEQILGELIQQQLGMGESR